MQDPHYAQTNTISLPLEDVTRNLTNNLHLRWSYGLLYLDQFTDEDDRPISIVYGLRSAKDSEIFHLRVILSGTKSNATNIEVHVSHVQTQGWPFVDDDGQSIVAKNPAEKHQQKFRKIADDILKFSQTEHGAGSGVFDLIRRAFVGGSNQRKYRR